MHKEKKLTLFVKKRFKKLYTFYKHTTISKIILQTIFTPPFSENISFQRFKTRYAILYFNVYCTFDFKLNFISTSAIRENYIYRTVEIIHIHIYISDNINRTFEY